MNKNLVGGIAAVVALAAMFTLSNCHRESPAPEPETPAPTVQTPDTPVPTPVTPPTKKPDTSKPVKPAPTPRKPLAKPNPNGTIYNRVEQGGKRGPAVGCTSVKPFAEGKSQAELAALAKQYKVTVENLNRYFVCTP